jgi:3D (Asp-Asp-Asp) domain-containing protein
MGFSIKNIKLMNRIVSTFAALFLFVMLIASCSQYETITKEVTATAYNSLAHQTHAEHSAITAWGDSLKPGMKSIAVSRDLIKQGLTYNKTVKIEGLPGEYKVLDKMNARWKNRIDIYMGKNEELAKEWGRQKVTISWKVKKEKYNKTLVQ